MKGRQSCIAVCKCMISSLIHVTDWLPTLYTLAGGNLNDLPNDIDGINQWSSLVNNLESPRTEMLYNSNAEGAAFRFVQQLNIFTMLVL